MIDFILCCVLEQNITSFNAFDSFIFFYFDMLRVRQVLVFILSLQLPYKIVVCVFVVIQNFKTLKCIIDDSYANNFKFNMK
jgi:hypothetical protein